MYSVIFSERQRDGLRFWLAVSSSQVGHDDKNLIIDGKKVRAFQEKEAGSIKWGESHVSRRELSATSQLNTELMNDFVLLYCDSGDVGADYVVDATGINRKCPGPSEAACNAAHEVHSMVNIGNVIRC
jgi:glyceraldehyde-3-phosphate dehydrogenase/erythrose-4-phosphate dehydrogenase